MNRFRSRFLFALITLIIAVLVGLGLLLGQIFNSYYLNTFKEELQREANSILTIISRDDLSNSQISELLSDLGKDYKSHITIIDEDDTILFDAGDLTQDLDMNSLKNNVLPIMRGQSKGYYYSDQVNGVAYYGLPIKEKAAMKGLCSLARL